MRLLMIVAARPGKPGREPMPRRTPMFEIQPLLLLKDSNADPLGVSAPPALYGAEGVYHGHEWARWRYDSLDERVDRLLEAARRKPLDVLDVGCASGVRAAALARAGHRVTAVDIVDRADDIAARNRETRHAMTGGCVFWPIAFRQADPRRDTVSGLAGPFDLVHARRVMNFMTTGEVRAFLSQVRRALRADGVFAACFMADDVADAAGMRRPAAPRGTPSLSPCPGLHVHHFSDVHGVMNDQGFSITEAFSDGRIEAGLIARLSV